MEQEIVLPDSLFLFVNEPSEEEIAAGHSQPAMPSGGSGRRTMRKKNFCTQLYLWFFHSRRVC